MKYLTLVIALAGCELKWTWSGIPNSIGVTCDEGRGTKRTCVGTDGLIYICIENWSNYHMVCAKDIR